ncbi:MAG: undecaprenyl-diphosphate phosphatase [Phycisphaerales bacterium]
MEWWQAAILGLVEGITEYLPISSTGHLVIASSLMGLDEDPAQKAAVDAFNIVIQGGAILAVLGLYWPRVLRMLKGLLGKDAGGRRLLVNIVIAFLPAAILGPLLDNWIESRLMSVGPVVGALVVGGVAMIVLDRLHRRPQVSVTGDDAGTGDNPRETDSVGSVDKPKRKTESEPASDPRPDGLDIDALTWRHALFIGLLQCVAMWPGTSRSMMTIVGGVLVGLKPKQAAEFSFLLGLPTLGGACVFKLAKNLWQARQPEHQSIFEMLGVAPILIGLAVATVSAALAVRWLVAFLGRHGLEPFGWYRIGLGIVLGVLVAIGLVSI